MRRRRNRPDPDTVAEVTLTRGTRGGLRPTRHIVRVDAVSHRPDIYDDVMLLREIIARLSDIVIELTEERAR